MSATRYFESLGTTPEEVADSLRRQGIKGKPRSRAKCPILIGLYKAYPDYWPGLIIENGYKDDSGWHYCVTLDDLQIIDPKPTQAVLDFIGRFDHGEFQDLAG